MTNRYQCALFLLYACSSYANGQSYLNPTARWTQSYSWTGFNANSHCRTVYYIEGDSLVNDTTYSKLHSNVDCFYNHTEYDSLGNPYQLTDTNSTISLACLIREENRKFIVRTGNQESVLYNFDLSNFSPITDAVQNPVCGLSAPSLMTHDTVCIGNELRKRWIISPSQYPLAYYFIEGVGPSSGFKAPVCRNGCPECSYSLNYFELNGDTLYSGYCNPLEANFVSQEKIQLAQSENGKVQFSSQNLRSIEIYTLQGKLIVDLDAKNGFASIDLNMQTPGIYIYRAIEFKNAISGKFILIH